MDGNYGEDNQEISDKTKIQSQSSSSDNLGPEWFSEIDDLNIEQDHHRIAADNIAFNIL